MSKNRLKRSQANRLFVSGRNFSKLISFNIQLKKKSPENEADSKSLESKFGTVATRQAKQLAWSQIKNQNNRESGAGPPLDWMGEGRGPPYKISGDLSISCGVRTRTSCRDEMDGWGM